MNLHLAVTVDKVTQKTESTKTPDPAGGRLRKTTWTYKLQDQLGTRILTIKSDHALGLHEDDYVDVDVMQRTWQAPLPKDAEDFPGKVRAAIRPGLVKFHAEAKAGQHGPMLKAAAERGERDTLIPASLPTIIDGSAARALAKANADAEEGRRSLGRGKPKKRPS